MHKLKTKIAPLLYSASIETRKLLKFQSDVSHSVQPEHNNLKQLKAKSRLIDWVFSFKFMQH